MKNSVSLIAVLFLVFSSYAQETYNLSKESSLTISGSSTIHDWTVTANAFEGSLEMNQGQVKSLLFQVAVDQIKSERGAAMDKKMHAALKQEAHPEVSFKLHELNKEEGSETTVQIIGILNIAGTAKEVHIISKFQKEEESYLFKGSKEIKLQDFGMLPPTAMFGQIVVGDNVTINFDLVFTR